MQCFSSVQNLLARKYITLSIFFLLQAILFAILAAYFSLTLSCASTVRIRIINHGVYLGRYLTGGDNGADYWLCRKFPSPTAAVLPLPSPSPATPLPSSTPHIFIPYFPPPKRKAENGPPPTPPIHQPFRNEYPVNPSWEIARSLPSHLPPPPAKARTAKDKAKDAAATATAAPPLLPPVRLLVHPEPVKVSYQAVRSLVPQLWHVGDDDDDDDAATGRPKVDLAVHIGMAGPQPRFSVERRGHRDGYAMRDVDGEFLRDQERRLREGRDWVWAGLPTELETEADLDDVLKRWKGYCPVSFFLFLLPFTFPFFLSVGLVPVGRVPGPISLTR